MAFTATPVDGSTTPIPMSSAVPDSTNTPLAVEGGPAKTTGGNTLTPVAVYQYDGYDVTQGLIADVAVTGDAPGTVGAKLRGLSKMWADIWDATNHWLQVKIMNANANGQATMVTSAPVVLASDQSPVKVYDVGAAWASVFQKASATETTAWAGTGDLTVGTYLYALVNINVTAFTGTNYQYKVLRKDAFGNYLTLVSSSVLTAAGGVTFSIGPACANNQLLGSTIEVLVAYTALTSITYSVDMQAR